MARSVAELLAEQASLRGDQVAVIDGARRLTYAELDRAVTGCALALLERGVIPGDRVVLSLTGADFVVSYLAAGRAGVVAVPVNPALTPPELDHVVSDAQAALVITDLASLRAGDPAVALPPPSELAVLLYTSGTTGRPRGAMLTSAALLANLEQIAALELITAADVLFVPVPLFHVFGLNGGLGVALSAGATLVLADRFDPDLSLAVMAAERVTAVAGVPGMYASWLTRPGFAVGFAAVRFAWSGSAGLPSALVAAFASRGVNLFEGYGLTETAPVIAVNWSAAGPVPGSVGRPLPGIELERRDALGGRAAAGDPGEIFVRGPNLFSGYWPDSADGPDDEGWFGTGDLAVSDDDGNLRLVGRTSDLVIVNGFNVYPAEVEAVLRALPGVAEVAVVGRPDPVSGEAVLAYVVAAPGASHDGSALLAAAAGSLARYKLPRQIEFVAALPHTVTGKVMKWRLTDAGA